MSSRLTTSQKLSSASSSDAACSPAPSIDSVGASRYAVSDVFPEDVGRVRSRNVWFGSALIATDGNSHAKRALSASDAPSPDIAGSPSQPPSSAFDAIGEVQKPTYMPRPCHR